MALCLATSLIECRGFNAHDQMRRYVLWWREGYLSSTGRCFDIGNTVRDALHRFERTGEPFSGSTDPYSAGNGSLMRLAPIPLWYSRNPRMAIRLAADSSRTTHGAHEAVDACRYMAGLLIGALQNLSKEQLLSPHFEPLTGIWKESPLTPKIAHIASGSFKQKNPPQIRGIGYVFESLEAALWAFYRTDSFQDALIQAVNLGDDADTTGAICGQLAGAFYGKGAIPDDWLNIVAERNLIESFASELYKASEELELN